MINIGLLGAGHLGKIHLRLLKEIETVNLVGFYDPSAEVAQQVAGDFGVKAFGSIAALLAEVDALDIVTPTLSHFDCAMQAIAAGKHIFVEKPITHTVAEAETLVQKIEAAGLKAQVGHVERFNPAFLSVADIDLNPLFIEGHRLAVYNPRGTDVSVVLDLMIHDLDIVLSMVDSPLESISASGVAVVSDTPDIANARIEFENGCVANLTASRISLKNMRRLRLFRKEAYVAIDFLKKQSEVVKLTEQPAGGPLDFPIETDEGTKYLGYELPEVKEVNAIKMELEEFAASILHDAPIRVSIQDGYRALKAAHEILAKIEEKLKRMKNGE